MYGNVREHECQLMNFSVKLSVKGKSVFICVQAYTVGPRLVDSYNFSENYIHFC